MLNLYRGASKAKRRGINLRSVQGRRAEDDDRNAAVRFRVDGSLLNDDAHGYRRRQQAHHRRLAANALERRCQPSRIDAADHRIPGCIQRLNKISGRRIDSEQVDRCAWNRVVPERKHERESGRGQRKRGCRKELDINEVCLGTAESHWQWNLQGRLKDVDRDRSRLEQNTWSNGYLGTVSKRIVGDRTSSSGIGDRAIGDQRRTNNDQIRWKSQLSQLC